MTFNSAFFKCYQVFKKLALGDYKWMSYNELANMSNSFGRGLRLLGQAPGSKIAIYAETRAEWMMSCLGAFSQVRIHYKFFVINSTSLISTFSEYPCLYCLHQSWRWCRCSCFEWNCSQCSGHFSWLVTKVQGDVEEPSRNQDHYLHGRPTSKDMYSWIQIWCQHCWI